MVLESSRSRFISTAVLGLFLLIVGAIVYFTTMPEEEPKDDFGKKIVDLNEDSYEIMSVRITSDEGVLSVRKLSDEWMVEEPVNTPADPVEAVLLTDIFRFLTEKRAIENPGDLYEYGLEPPVVTAVAGWKSPSGTGETTLLVGDNTIDDKGRYITVQGDDKLYMVPVFSLSGIEKDVKEVRLKQPLVRYVPWADVKRIKLKHFHNLEIFRDQINNDEGTEEVWLVSADGGQPVSGDKKEIIKIIRNILAVKAEKILEEGPIDLEKHGFGDDDFLITLEVENLPDVTLRFGPVLDNLTRFYADTELDTPYGDMPLFLVSPRKISGLFPLLPDVKDRQIALLDESLSGMKLYVNEKDEEENIRTEIELKPEELSDFKSQYSEIRALRWEYGDVERWIPDPASLEVELLYSGNSRMILIGKNHRTGDGNYASTGDRDGLFILPNSLIDSFFKLVTK